MKAKAEGESLKKKGGKFKTISVKDGAEGELVSALKETEFLVKLRQSLILGNDQDFLINSRDKVGIDNVRPGTMMKTDSV